MFLLERSGQRPGGAFGRLHGLHLALALQQDDQARAVVALDEDEGQVAEDVIKQHADPVPAAGQQHEEHGAQEDELL